MTNEGAGGYKPVPEEATQAPGTAAASEKVLALLKDVARRKEFGALRGAKIDEEAAKAIPGFVEPSDSVLGLPGMRLHGAQLFDQNLFNPDTPYQRILVDWQTGTGKTIDVVSIARRFIRSFRQYHRLSPENQPSVFVIGFTRTIFIQDMLKYPELGFISYAELEELRRVRVAAERAGPASQEAHHLAGLLGTYRRRITDRARGGYFRFYGYKEFANALFTVTRQGQKKGFDIQSLYEKSGRTKGQDFGELLSEKVRAGDVVVRTELLQSMRGGLMIADEIHNVYNVRAKNNYGIALQYALDHLGDEAPRSVFVSATAVTGSAMEVVDLLNLLVPKSQLPGGVALRRSDFFGTPPPEEVKTEAVETDEEVEGERPVSQLLPGALERIAHFAAGRVSFLLDTDTASYPLRRIKGEELSAIPYLKFTQCPMSELHEKTLSKVLDAMTKEGKTFRGFLPPGAYSLYDMVFPNPAGDEGLYQSGEVAAKLRAAPAAWKEKAGVIVTPGPELGLSQGINVVSGTFLAISSVQEYSGKYAALIRMVLESIVAGPGKLMIYHPRVRTSGVLLIQELLRMNGFADEVSAPTGKTICAVCGVAQENHSATDHAYTPARFVMAHSEVDRAVMERSIEKFNSLENAQGYQYRIAVGAKIVTEGRNFRAVRKLFVVSLPTDIPTLIQVFGRVVRKDSHIELPPEERNVDIYTLVSVYASKSAESPEVLRCASKMDEYLVIQQVMSALRKYAVDGFANYPRMIAADPSLASRATLESLPFAPAIDLGAQRTPLSVSTFEAYGYGAQESALIRSIIRVLFDARPVWTYGDLWAAVRSGAVRGVGYDPATFTEENFALALEGSTKRGDKTHIIVFAAPYYVLCPLDPAGRPIISPEVYLRPTSAPLSKLVVPLSGYLRKTQHEKQFESRLKEFNARYLSGQQILIPGGMSVPLLELSLLEMESDFHIGLLQRLIKESFRLGLGKTKVTADDAAVIGLYRRFKILLTAKEVARSREYRGDVKALQKIDQATPAGYLGRRAVSLWMVPFGNPISKGNSEQKSDLIEWQEVPLTAFKIGKRFKENNILVGFVTDAAAHAAQARFKIRPPWQKIQKRQVSDARSIERGAVCETRTRDELMKYVSQLRGEMKKVGGANGQALAASSVVRQRFPPITARTGSTTEMCLVVKVILLSLEEMERSEPNGMEEGIRWLYLFHDNLPSLS